MQFITNNQPTDSRMSLMQILGLSQQLYSNTPQSKPEYETSEHTTLDEPDNQYLKK